jgi:hypothetical protein
MFEQSSNLPPSEMTAHSVKTEGICIPLNYPQYNDWAFQPILHQHFNRLRARLLNLAETSTRDKQQAEAMKGLIKDFINEAYYPSLGAIEDFCRDKGLIKPEDRSNEGPTSQGDFLTADSLADILYEPKHT